MNNPTVGARIVDRLCFPTDDESIGGTNGPLIAVEFRLDSHSSQVLCITCLSD